jgi:hypothetical protein
VAAVRAAGQDPVLVFVPDRRTARSLARDLITFADASVAAARAANVAETDADTVKAIAAARPVRVRLRAQHTTD